MLIRKFLTLAAVCFLFFISCKNDFDVIDNWKNIPVVYGVISRNDSAHYLRLEKAFLDKTTSALVIAQRPDSLYYNNATVQLKRVSDGAIYTFSRVDGNLEGYMRDSGVFANAPNYLYKYKVSANDTLIADQVYQLIVKDENDKEMTTATINAVGKYTQVQNTPVTQMPVRFDRKLDLAFTSAEKTAYFYDCYMRFNYSETTPADPNTFIDKSVFILMEKGAKRDGADTGNPSVRYQYRILGEDFYKKIALNIAPSTNGIRRKFKSIDWVMYAGAKELYDYINIGQANIGITGAEAPPVYTNLANGAYGLFSTRSINELKNFTLDTEARDSLKNSTITIQLNFQ